MLFVQLLLLYRSILLCAPEKRGGFGSGRADDVRVPACESRSERRRRVPPCRENTEKKEGAGRCMS